MEMTKSQIIAEIEQCKKRIEELDKIAQDMKDDELKIWEPKSGERYLYIRSDGATSISNSDCFLVRRNRSIFHNVFPESSRDACTYYSHNIIRVQNMLWQLHELLCPDYFPDWNNDSTKYYCFYSHKNQEWVWCQCINLEYNTVYFTYEAAIKACEILNRDGVVKK